MAGTPDNAEAAELHQVSVEFWLSGRRDEALLAFRQALGGESDAIALQLRDSLPNSYENPDATPDRPINLQQQNAFAAYRNTVRMATDDARAWFNVGLTHEKEARESEARQAFEESFKSYHRNLAAKALQGAAPEVALELCRRVVEIDERDAKAWINLGAALGQMQQHDEELEAYRKAIDIAPKYAEAWYNLGVARARQEQDAEAIHAYKQALILSPKFAKAWFNLGVLQGKLGNPNVKTNSIAVVVWKPLVTRRRQIRRLRLSTNGSQAWFASQLSTQSRSSMVTCTFQKLQWCPDQWLFRRHQIEMWAKYSHWWKC